MELRSELSKKYIAEALIILMQKKPYNAITVKDITEKAGLSHMTYHRNFKSKDDILVYHLDRITNEFIKRTHIFYPSDNFRDYLIILLRHMKDQSELFLLLHKAGLIHYVKNEFDKIFSNKAASKKEEYNYCFISGGLYNVCHHWIVNGCKEPLEEIADMFLDFLKRET